MLHGWSRMLWRALLPPRCLVCNESGCNESGCDDRDCCRACLAALPWLGAACEVCALPLPDAVAARCGSCLQALPPLDATTATFVYRWPVDGLLRRFKFHQDLAAGRLLATLMRERHPGLARPDALVPVPLHRTRLGTRGYDQALELARPLARALEVPCRRLLVRERATTAQSALDAAERARNLRDAFRIRGAVPAHVILVDDVMTTGATLRAAALALRRAGAQRVDAWVCARVP